MELADKDMKGVTAIGLYLLKMRPKNAKDPNQMSTKENIKCRGEKYTWCEYCPVTTKKTKKPSELENTGKLPAQITHRKDNLNK